MAPACWHAAVKWIESNGGLVHQKISLVEESTGGRRIKVFDSIVEDECMLRIPSNCLVSCQSVQSLPFGRRVLKIIEGLDDNQLYHSKQDLALAIFLAALQAALDDQSQFFEPYISTLPHSGSFDTLPSRWEERQVESLLAGSNIVSRIRDKRKGVTQDYKQIQEVWTIESVEMPSFSKFHDMLSAVSSRAFVRENSPQHSNVVMVPLLDLCNHYRGSGMKKNVSYHFGENGEAIVTAFQNLERGDELRITYGALGNAQLLLNYGFCIINNLEPDGSSNDVLEVHVKSGCSPVELRSGPASYTFGGFVKALELMHPQHNNAQQFVESENDHDMNSFLKECENEEDMDEEDFLGELGDIDADECEVAEDKESEVAETLVALDSLGKALRLAQNSYSFRRRELCEALGEERTPPKHYAAILVASEQRILSFYIKAIELVKAHLNNSEVADTVQPVDQDEIMLERQANDLAGAFMKIRFPGHECC